MNPLSLNPTLGRTFSSYSRRLDLVEDRSKEGFSLRRTENISRALEGERKSSQRNIVSSHVRIKNYWDNMDYENIVNLCKAVIEDDLDQNLTEIGHEFLKGADIREKLFWCRKYDIVNDFIFKNLEKFLIESTLAKEDVKGGLSSTFNSSFNTKLTQNSDLIKSGTIKVTPKIGAVKSDAEYCIRLLISYFESQQKRKSNQYLFEPSVSELKDLLRDSE